jgi:tetratricopeptide (TPR) repeat protein
VASDQSVTGSIGLAHARIAQGIGRMLARVPDLRVPARTSCFALDPGNVDTLRQYATLAWMIGRPQQALELAQKAVLRDPLDSWSYDALVLAQNEGGRIEDSLTSWRKALDLDPTVGLYIALLANAYLADGKPAEALSTIEQEPIDQMQQSSSVCRG